jgi:hypothetical protein
MNSNRLSMDGPDLDQTMIPVHPLEGPRYFDAARKDGRAA